VRGAGHPTGSANITRARALLTLERAHSWVSPFAGPTLREHAVVEGKGREWVCRLEFGSSTP
jgi:hypothetical protein